MDIIYSQAYLTLIARATESAASPLPGVRPGTRMQRARTKINGTTLELLRPNAFDTENVNALSNCC